MRIKKVLKNIGDEWMVNVAKVEPVITEAKDGIIDEVGGASVVVFECPYTCV